MDMLNTDIIQEITKRLSDEEIEVFLSNSVFKKNYQEVVKRNSFWKLRVEYLLKSNIDEDSENWKKVYYNLINSKLDFFELCRTEDEFALSLYRTYYDPKPKFYLSKLLETVKNNDARAYKMFTDFDKIRFYPKDDSKEEDLLPFDEIEKPLYKSIIDNDSYNFILPVIEAIPEVNLEEFPPGYIGLIPSLMAKGCIKTMIKLFEIPKFRSVAIRHIHHFLYLAANSKHEKSVELFELILPLIKEGRKTDDRDIINLLSTIKICGIKLGSKKLKILSESDSFSPENFIKILSKCLSDNRETMELVLCDKIQYTDKTILVNQITTKPFLKKYLDIYKKLLLSEDIDFSYREGKIFLNIVKRLTVEVLEITLSNPKAKKYFLANSKIVYEEVMKSDNIDFLLHLESNYPEIVNQILS